MVNYKGMLAACGAAVLTVLGAAAVTAWDNPNHTTYVTVNTPFALPGVALPPGTYVFERAAPDSNLNLIRVSSRDHKQVYLTAFTHQVDRPKGLPPTHVITFGEFKAGMTPPVTVWYPIGSSTGHQFIYPKNSRQLGDR